MPAAVTNRRNPKGSPQIQPEVEATRGDPLAHRISLFGPPPSKTPSTKPQAPEKFKSQTPNPKNRCGGQRRAGRFQSLEFGASLELGVWNGELVAWALSFSKIEMRPVSISVLKSL